MALPPDFAFTQTALRAYLECPYRFRLRYLSQVPWTTWPPEAGAEDRLERGRRFHELARQHYLGLEVDDQAAAEPGLAAWWDSLRAAPPDLTPYPDLYPEAGLSIPLGDYRLAARYDLLAAGPAGALVIDWKTGQALAQPRALAQHIQTRVYLYVLAEGGSVYHGGRSWAPSALAILYWHPQGPQQVRLSYSAAQQSDDRAFLTALVGEIAAHAPDEFQPTSDRERCVRCAYAPLCGLFGSSEEWEVEESDTGDDLAAGVPPLAE